MGIPGCNENRQWPDSGAGNRGFGCDETPDADCDVTFTVTGIDLDPTCLAPERLPSGQRYLRVEVDAESTRPFVYHQAEAALELPNWSVEGSTGMRQLLTPSPACSADLDLFTKPLVAQLHVRDSVVVAIPGDAEFLRLDYLATAWRWPLRPPI